VPFLKVGINLKVIPVYRCGAAKRQTVGCGSSTSSTNDSRMMVQFWQAMGTGNHMLKEVLLYE